MTEIAINPIEDKITLKNCSIMDDGTYGLYDFKNLCFKNGWEGTLFKIASAEQFFWKTMDEVYPREDGKKHPDRKILKEMEKDRIK